MDEMNYTPIFGNIEFQIMPSTSGEVSDTFGIILNAPSVEGLVYAQQINAQTSPTDILSGQNTGEQNIQGSYTVQNSLGQNKVLLGYSENGF